jgi:hypothetical protein
MVEVGEADLTKVKTNIRVHDVTLIGRVVMRREDLLYTFYACMRSFSLALHFCLLDELVLVS